LTEWIVSEWIIKASENKIKDKDADAADASVIKGEMKMKIKPDQRIRRKRPRNTALSRFLCGSTGFLPRRADFSNGPLLADRGLAPRGARTATELQLAIVEQHNPTAKAYQQADFPALPSLESARPQQPISLPTDLRARTTRAIKASGAEFTI